MCVVYRVVHRVFVCSVTLSLCSLMYTYSYTKNYATELDTMQQHLSDTRAELLTVRTQLARVSADATQLRGQSEAMRKQLEEERLDMKKAIKDAEKKVTEAEVCAFLTLSACLFA